MRKLTLVLTFFSSLLLSPTLYSQHMDLCVEDIPIEPYIYDRNSPTSAQGILPDLLKIAGQKHGIEIRYFRNPWKRCINMVKAQAIDGLFALIRNKDREWGRHSLQIQHTALCRRAIKSLLPRALI